MVCIISPVNLKTDVYSVALIACLSASEFFFFTWSWILCVMFGMQTLCRLQYCLPVVHYLLDFPHAIFSHAGTPVLHREGVCEYGWVCGLYLPFCLVSNLWGLFFQMIAVSWLCIRKRKVCRKKWDFWLTWADLIWSYKCGWCCSHVDVLLSLLTWTSVQNQNVSISDKGVNELSVRV